MVTILGDGRLVECGDAREAQGRFVAASKPANDNGGSEAGARWSEGLRRTGMPEA